MKYISSLLVLGFSLINLSAATFLAWDKNPEPDINYLVVTLQNGSPVSTNDVGSKLTYEIPSLPGSERSFYVLAYSTDTLMVSLPSQTVTHREFLPIPAISATSYNLGSFKANQWQNVKISWPGIDKVKYGFTNYTLLAVAGSTTNTYSTANTNYTIATLPRATWNFYVQAENNIGKSPLGKALVLDGTSPQAPKNVIVID